MLNANNPHMTFSSFSNPVWAEDAHGDCVSSYEDEADSSDDDDPRCPTIKLTKEQKTRLMNPWKNVVIIKMFDKGVGYMQLQKRLKSKWSLEGDFSLIDI